MSRYESKRQDESFFVPDMKLLLVLLWEREGAANRAESSQMNCLRNSVATSLPRVFTDNFSSLISLSMSCTKKVHRYHPTSFGI